MHSNGWADVEPTLNDLREWVLHQYVAVLSSITIPVPHTRSNEFTIGKLKPRFGALNQLAQHVVEMHVVATVKYALLFYKLPSIVCLFYRLQYLRPLSVLRLMV